MKKLLILTVLTLLVWTTVVVQTSAQSTSPRLESRIDRLESEISRLSSRLSQIETRSGLPTPPPASSSGGSPNDLSLDEQFDNLATLAIELKLQVRALEERVTQLEQR